MRRRMFLVKSATPPPVENYLRVQPVSVQWVTMTEPVVYTVESNVEWILT